jgi:putative FmdB family regulatory protein
MPIYEYVCNKCKNKFELMRPITMSGEPADCPTCKAKAIRVMSRFMCITTNAVGDPERLPGAGPSGGPRPTGCSGCMSTNCDSCGS